MSLQSMAPRPADLAGPPLVIELPVQWGDQDAFGHVNNTVYFRWMESARIEYFDASGLDELMEKQGVGPILASITCDYRKQVKHPDDILVTSSLTSIGNTSMNMSHKIYSKSQNAVAAEGKSVIVLFDYQKQTKVVVPAEMRAKVAEFEGSARQ